MLEDPNYRNQSELQDINSFIEAATRMAARSDKLVCCTRSVLLCAQKCCLVCCSAKVHCRTGWFCWQGSDAQPQPTGQPPGRDRAIVSVLLLHNAILYSDAPW